jgi:nitroreductase
VTPTAHEVNHVKHAPEVEGVLPVFFHRWSPRSFAGREVSLETIAKCFEAARWAASSFNEQPWRFFLGTRGNPTYKKIFESLGEFNQAWAASAPVLILGVAKTRFSHNDAPNRVALYDLGAAASYMTLQAAHLGLVTHQMAGVDLDKARKLLEIPEEYVIGAAIALGYQGEPEALTNENMRQQEISPRQRKPLSEIVLAGWGEPAKLA